MTDGRAMKDDGTDWAALVEKRLAEVRREKQAEAQAAGPPPGPEAAAEVLDRMRAASEAAGKPTERIVLPEAIPPEGDSAFPSPSSVPEQPFDCAQGREPVERRRRRHRRLSWHRVKRPLFFLVLLALFLGGLCLTFSPQLKALIRFLGPDRDTSENGLILPEPPAEQPKQPKEPKSPVPAPAPEKPPAPVTDPAQAGRTRPEPDPGAKREPAAKPPEPKAPPEVRMPPEPKMPAEPPVPPEPAKPVDPATMPAPPKPPEAPKLPVPPTFPWDTRGDSRPAEPRDRVG